MNARAWRVGEWPPLAWLETALKLLAVAVGVAALVVADDGGEGSGVRVAQIVVLGLLALGLVAAIADRLLEREVVGIVFVVLSNLGHWSLLAALALGPADGHLLAFAALMLAGEVVKLAFLATSGFRVRQLAPGVVMGLTGAYALGYAALAALALVGG